MVFYSILLHQDCLADLILEMHRSQRLNEEDWEKTSKLKNKSPQPRQ